ncbi:hypothetical protein Tco_0578098 [Tanacetum coccineum]
MPVSERPPSPSPTIPETEWVFPNPVSPLHDWRPWPYVPVHSPIRDPTPEPESPPTPPAQTFIFEEPLVFGPEPRPAGYVDPDVIEPIILAHSPDPMIHPLHGGFHVESPVRPDDAPTPTADAAGRAEDPALLTGLSAKLDRCMGRIDSLETELGKSKKIMRGAILTLVSRVKKLEKTVKQLRETRLVVEASAAKGDVDIQDDLDLDGLSRMASTTLEDAQARKCFEEEQASEQTDWLNLMMQVGSNPALARELLGADVNKENFIERMNAVKEKKRLEIGISLLSAQYNLFRPKPAITEPPSKRQRVERVSSQPASVPAATTLPADDPDSAGGGSSNPAGSATPMAGSAASNTAGGAFGATVTDFTVTTTAAMDSAGSRRKIGVSPFADSAAGPSPFLSSIAGGPSPSNVSTDQIPIAVLFESTSGDINELVSAGCTMILLVVILPAGRLLWIKHLGVRSDDFLWDKPVEDFFSSESESDDDMENYIPPLPYGEFKDWEIVSCPPGNNYIHVYYQENRRRKYFTYLKELLPHVYREDLLLLRRRMNRYFRLNPEVDVGLELWRDVNMLCQSLHPDDVEDFWRTQDEWIVSSWKLYPKSSVHVLDLTNGKTVYMFVDKFYPIRATLLERMLRHRLTVPPSYCRDVVVAGNIIQTVQAGLRQAYECIASAPIACTARQMVFSSPWLTAKKESGSPLQTALVCNSNPLMVARLPKTGCPEQTATGKDMLNPLYGCDGLPKTVRVFQFTLDSRSEKLDWFLLHQDWKLLFFDVATSFDSVVHRVHAVSFDAVVLDIASTVSAACIVVAGYIVSAGICHAAVVSAGQFQVEFLLFLFLLVNNQSYNYKNDVELEYHVDQLKAAVVSEAQWNNDEGDVSKPRSFELGSRELPENHQPYQTQALKIPYTMTGTEKGVVYLNRYNRQSLMKLNEVHKFCDGTLTKIQENLINMLTKNKLGQSNERLKGRD